MQIEAPARVLMTGDDLVEPAMRVLAPFGATLVTMAGPIDEARMLSTLAAGHFDALLVRGNPPLNDRVLDAAPSLKIISKMGAGIDSVDLATATERGIPVMTAGDANADATAEMTIALILALRRDIVRLDARIKAGFWDRGTYLGTELRGQTLGIVGLGRIGRRVAEMATALGLRVVVAARLGSGGTEGGTASGWPRIALHALLKQSDIVSLHCPLTQATRGLIGAEALQQMKPGALLINTARGALLDEAAVAEALRAGKLGGLAVDTLSKEPPPADNPLLAAPNIIITPHIGAETAATLDLMASRAAENIVLWLRDRRIVTDRLVNGHVVEQDRRSEHA